MLPLEQEEPSRRSSTEDEDSYLASAAQEAEKSREHGEKKHRLKTFFKEGKKLLDHKEKDLRPSKVETVAVSLPNNSPAYHMVLKMENEALNRFATSKLQGPAAQQLK